MNESNTLIATITQGQTMDAAAVATIGALTTALVQILKRSLPGDWDAYGPLFAAIISLLGVALWVYSAPQFPPARTDVWAIAAGWVAVFSTSVGVYQTVKMATAPTEISFRRRLDQSRGTRVPDAPPVVEPADRAA